MKSNLKSEDIVLIIQGMINNMKAGEKISQSIFRKMADLSGAEIAEAIVTVGSRRVEDEKHISPNYDEKSKNRALNTIRAVATGCGKTLTEEQEMKLLNRVTAENLSIDRLREELLNDKNVSFGKSSDNQGERDR